MKDPDIFGGSTADTPTIRDKDIFFDVTENAGRMQKLPTMRDSLREEMSGKPVASAMAGFGTILDNAAIRAKQMFSGLTPQDEAKARMNRELTTANPWAYAGSIAGNAAVLGPLAGQSITGNAAVGAGAGFMDPVLDNEQGAGKAAMGGIFGAAGGAAGKLMTGSPVITPAPQVQALLKSGVVPTIGQAANYSPSRFGRFVAGKEEQIQSVPFLGDFITNARNRAVEDFNRAAINKGMPPGQTATAIGKDGVDIAKQALGTAYDDIYKNATVAIDNRLLGAVAAAKTSPVVPMNQAGMRQFDDIMKKTLWDRLPAGQSMPSRDAKMSIEADLGAAVRQLKFSSNSADRSVGQALEAARNAFRDLMARNLPPDDAAKLQPVNQAYANMTAVKAAAEKAKARGGVFTPFQLQQASKKGEMREFADFGTGLTSRTPDSGTAGRAITAGLLGMGTPAASAYFLGAPMLGALGAAPLAYSRTGSRWLLGDLTPKELQALAPYIAQGGQRHLQENNR
jgi:hypothetical protein